MLDVNAKMHIKVVHKNILCAQMSLIISISNKKKCTITINGNTELIPLCASKKSCDLDHVTGSCADLIAHHLKYCFNMCVVFSLRMSSGTSMLVSMQRSLGSAWF